MAAIAAVFAICAAAAEAEWVVPASKPREFSRPAAGSSVDIEAALARVNEARSRTDGDPLALEDALTALGDALLHASQYQAAEAAYAEALRLVEQHDGSRAERVLAPLLGEGKALAGSGHHQEAVPRLQRALAITRAQYGLFDLRQQDTLKTLAASLTALDRIREAQDLLLYRARVAEKAYGEASPEVIPALCDLGNWFAEIGLSLEARMAFQVALNIGGSKLSLNDPVVVEPLRGMARTRMLAQSYPESPLRPHESSVIRYNAMGIPMLGPKELNREGEDALQRALLILESDPRASPQSRIETLIQMGDWYQIKKSPREALPYYQRAWQVIRTAPGLPGPAATALDDPVRVYYPTPAIVAYLSPQLPEETRSNFVEIEFTVAADGSVSEARVVDHNTRDLYARDILDAVRAARFRPKFFDGQAVATPGMAYREVFWTAQHRAGQEG